MYYTFFDRKTMERPEYLLEDEFYMHGRVIKSSKKSLYLFSNKNPIRKVLVWVNNWKVFDAAILFLIAFNSILLGPMDYTPGGEDNFFNKMADQLESPFLAIFTIEAVIRILADGLILGKKCYLADAWNWLDFIVVVTGLLSLVVSSGSVSGLRTFRLFRPLKSLSSMKNMKVLIQTLLSSISQLGGVFGLAIFFFMIFAILGVSLWSGNAHYRC